MLALATGVGAWLAGPAGAAVHRTVTLLHFSDYHSHALPYYSHGTAGVGGIARAVAYLRPWARRRDALVLSGGDMLNHGAPTWSDRYGCIEWPWLDGVVSAMAYGNHDADQGPEAFARCRGSVHFPILGANVRDATGAPVFAWHGHDYAVFTVGGVRLGLFATAGPDFDRLVHAETRPVPGAVFTDRTAAARAVVAALRDREHVAAVVLIGHAHADDDAALARAVPGIDLIFGTHSHRRQELTQIPGTHTWTLAPYQYLEYVSRVELAFTDNALTGVTGALVRMDPSRPEDPVVAARVRDAQAALAADPVLGVRFRTVGTLPRGLETDGELTRDAALPDQVLDGARDALHVQVVAVTASTFREPVAPGAVNDDDLLRAMPYPSTLQQITVTGTQLQALLDASVARRDTDFFLQVAGLRFTMAHGHATGVAVRCDTGGAPLGFCPVRPEASYALATTDFVTGVAYRDVLAGVTPTPTRVALRDVLRSQVTAGTALAAADGRIADTVPLAP